MALISDTAIRFISDPEVAKIDLTRLLQHKPSPSSAEDTGGGADTHRPEAFLLGLGYTNEVVDELRDSCKGVGDGVPWLVGGFSKDEFKKLVDSKRLGPPEKHGPIAAQMQKKKLLEVLREGKGGRDGVFTWYEG